MKLYLTDSTVFSASTMRRAIALYEQTFGEKPKRVCTLNLSRFKREQEGYTGGVLPDILVAEDLIRQKKARELEAARALRKNGSTYAQIGKAMGRSSAYIFNLLLAS